MRPDQGMDDNASAHPADSHGAARNPNPDSFVPINPLALEVLVDSEPSGNQEALRARIAQLEHKIEQLTAELSETLQQQTATSEVLQVIASSPGELKPVFQTMLENATRVCGASFGIMNLWDGDKFTTVAGYNVPPAFATARLDRSIRPHPKSGLAAVVRICTNPRHSGRGALPGGGSHGYRNCTSRRSPHNPHGARGGEGRRTDRNNHHLSPGLKGLSQPVMTFNVPQRDAARA